MAHGLFRQSGPQLLPYREMRLLQSAGRGPRQQILPQQRSRLFAACQGAVRDYGRTAAGPPAPARPENPEAHEDYPGSPPWPEYMDTPVRHAGVLFL